MTHNVLMGYILLVWGFTGSERFYYGRPVSGTIYFFTFGLLGIGWFLNLFLIPSMVREADFRFKAGRINYNGPFGVHRFYMGKWISGIVYLCTFGIFGVGYNTIIGR